MALPPLHDTIAAIATAPGVGAIGIIRLSGPDSYAIAHQIFQPKRQLDIRQLAAGRVIYGRITEAEELVDEALLLSFRQPHSYTAQDVIELQSHGGPAVLRRVLELCLSQGARLAQPGEFTLRAYLNGRLDLSQAESVLNLVNAQSDSARRQAALGLGKELSRQLDLIQSDITRVYGNIQAVFDYPDEGVSESERQLPLARAIARIDQLLKTAKAAQIVRQGARLALIGKPNAGKSSLLNALLGYERSIVSDLPGTTRDYLEAPLDLEGVPVIAIDTAGLRDTQDHIEAIGVTRAQEFAKHADVTLLLLDGNEVLTEDIHTILAELETERLIVVKSKSDLPQLWQEADLGMAVQAVSTVTGKGIATLKDYIRTKLLGDAGSSELWLGSDRQAEILKAVRELIIQAQNAPDELAALDLEDALRQLAEFTGRSDIAEETLEHIFANFCVGK